MISVTRELLERYHKGECTIAEAKAVIAWLEHADAEMSFPQQEDIQTLQQTSWQHLQARIAYTNTLHKKRRKKLVVTVLSVLVVAIMGNYLYRWYRTPVYQTLVAANGHKKHLQLEDGTEIWLNSGSKLIYPEHFKGNKRNVTLTGEAYFKVFHNTKKPFVISCTRGKIKVLGTQFNVKAYPEAEEEHVTVIEGKVKFSNNKTGKAVFLTPDQQGILRKEMSEPITKTVKATLYNGWKDNILTFNNTPLPEVVKTLEKWYGIQVKMASDTLSAQRYTGRFENPSLQEFLRSFGFAMGLHYHYHHKILTLYK